MPKSSSDGYSLRPIEYQKDEKLPKKMQARKLRLQANTASKNATADIKTPMKQETQSKVIPFGKIPQIQVPRLENSRKQVNVEPNKWDTNVKPNVHVVKKTSESKPTSRRRKPVKFIAPLPTKSNIPAIEAEIQKSNMHEIQHFQLRRAATTESTRKYRIEKRTSRTHEIQLSAIFFVGVFIYIFINSMCVLMPESKIAPNTAFLTDNLVTAIMNTLMQNNLTSADAHTLETNIAKLRSTSNYKNGYALDYNSRYTPTDFQSKINTINLSAESQGILETYKLVYTDKGILDYISANKENPQAIAQLAYFETWQVYKIDSRSYSALKVIKSIFISILFSVAGAGILFGINRADR